MEAADIDVLDGLFQTAIRLGDGRLEGIEIHHHHVDGDDPVLLIFLACSGCPGSRSPVILG